ncbi:MAG: D-alanine--D-alanine ligase [Bacteroidota bacterium]
MQQTYTLVAFGGVSPEHEVSVLTAMQAIAALRETDRALIPLYITKKGRWLTGSELLDLENYEDLDQLISQSQACTFSHDQHGAPCLLETESSGWFSSPKSYPIDVVITAFHGSEGENGSFQGTCEQYNIPYTGCGVLASAIGMDKVKTKKLCQVHDIPVVQGIDFTESQWIADVESWLQDMEQLGYPVILKPVHLGSSIGVTRIEHSDEAEEAIEEAFRYDAHLLIEKAIQPLKEINCSVLGHGDELQTSVCERPLGQEELLSFEDKYQRGEDGGKGMASQDRIIPADIEDDMTKRIQKLSRSIFRMIDGSGLARLDFLVHAETNEIYFNEINTIPGSFSFYLWDHSDYSMKDLMLKLIEFAHQAHREKNGRIRSYETNLLSQKAITGLKGLKGNK